MDTSGECQRKEYPEDFGNGLHQGEEEGVAPKYLDAGNNDMDENKRTGGRRLEWQGWVEKKNKTLGTERCVNIGILYIKIIITIIIIIIYYYLLLLSLSFIIFEPVWYSG